MILNKSVYFRTLRRYGILDPNMGLVHGLQCQVPDAEYRRLILKRSGAASCAGRSSSSVFDFTGQFDLANSPTSDSEPQLKSPKRRDTIQAKQMRTGASQDVEKNIDQYGFSLIELMIVVAIIGLMSTIAIPNLVTGMKTRLARSHMNSIAKVFRASQMTDAGPRSLIEVVQSTVCLRCEVGLGSARDMTNYVPPPLYDTYWMRLGFEKTVLDPWGHAYIVDLNDGEVHCLADQIWSAGPDGFWEGIGGGDDAGGDDILIHGIKATVDCPINL